jgi:hypothetical protein
MRYEAKTAANDVRVNEMWVKGDSKVRPQSSSAADLTHVVRMVFAASFHDVTIIPGVASGVIRYRAR